MQYRPEGVLRLYRWTMGLYEIVSQAISRVGHCTYARRQMFKLHRNIQDVVNARGNEPARHIS